MIQKDSDESSLHGMWGGHTSRRALLQHAMILCTAASGVGGLLAACGGDDTESNSEETPVLDNASPTSPPGSNTQPQSTEPPLVPAATTTSAAPTVGGTLTVAISHDLVSLDPHIAGAHSDFNILRHLYEGLVTLDDATDIIPMLADDWEISSDGLTYTFNLRRGVRFHNGDEMTAADAKYSLDRFRNESTRNGDLLAVEAVEAPDEYTITLSLSGTDATILAMLANPYVIAVIPKDSVAPTELVQEAVGTGPFKFETWVQNNQLTFSRFDDYVPVTFPTTGLGGEKRALVDELVIRVVADNQTAIAGLQTGELDLAVNIPPRDAERLSETDDALTITEVPGTFVSVMYFNVKELPMSDKRFRQAILSAIDKEAFLEAVYFGHGTVVPWTFIPESSIWYNEDHAHDPLPYDPEKAMALLEEMGYDGEPVSITSGDPEQRTQAIALQSLLAEVGIVTEVQHLERALYTQLLRSGGYQIFSSGSPIRVDPDQRYSLWHCTRSSVEFDYCDPAYDKLIDDARSTVDFEARKDLYGKAERILKEDAIVAPVYFKNIIYASSNRVQNLVVNPYDWWQCTNVWIASD